MRSSIVWTILRREWYETLHNRLLLITILVPPILLTVVPLVVGSLVGARALPAEIERSVLAQKPEWAAFSQKELTGAFAVQQFLAFFLLMPAYIPLSIASRTMNAASGSRAAVGSSRNTTDGS